MRPPASASRKGTYLLPALLTVGVLASGCAGAQPTDGSPDPARQATAATGVSPGQSPGPSPGQSPGQTPATGHTDASATGAGPANASPTETGSATSQPGEVSIAFVGDVMLGRSVGERILDGQDPFDGVARELAGADLVIGTLETTVGEGGEPQEKAFTFQAPPEAVDSLLAGGFDLVALANNHSYDYGADGILGTVDLLDAAGLAHVGAGANADSARAPVTLSEGGVDTAVLSYVDVPDDWTGYRNRDWAATSSSPGVAWAEPDDIAADVAAAGADSDHVVVLLHAGTEGSHQPSEVQRTAADAALAAGATAVIGGHPHVLQGYRHEDGRLTAWSLGNFVFDGFGDDPDASRSTILNLTLDEDGITDLTWTPVAIVDGLPVALEPGSEQGRAILDHLETLPG